MKVKLILTVAITFISFTRLFAQSADEEAIKQAIRTETESYYNRNMTAWKESFVQSGKTTVTYVNPNGYSHHEGWENFGVPLLGWVAKNHSRKNLMSCGATTTSFACLAVPLLQSTTR